MTKQQYIEHCRSILSAEVDQPFDEDFDTWVARHSDNRKWFALIFDVKGRPAVNLKCDPMEADFLRSVYEGVTPAYHMNKQHWISVILDGSMTEEEVFRLICDSHALTAPRIKRKK